MRKVPLLFLSVALLVSACAAPQVPITLTSSATWTPSPTDTITLQPTATRRPSLTSTPTQTRTSRPRPTLPGPDVTRTPAPKAQCPQPIHPPPTITFSKRASDVGPQILQYLNTRGSAVGLQTV